MEEEVHANSRTMKGLDQIEGTMVSKTLEIESIVTMKVKNIQIEAQNSNY